MRLIPGKTKVKIELFKGITISDIIIIVVALGLVSLVLLSTLPGRIYIAAGVAALGVLLLIRIDGRSNFMGLVSLLRYIALPRRFGRMFSDEHLLTKNQESVRGEQWNKYFADKYTPEEDLSLRESIEKIMSDKAKKREEDKLLNSDEIGDEEKNAIWKAREEQEKAKSTAKAEQKRDSLDNERDMEELMPFTGIADGFIEYNGKYYGTVIEIDPVEFRFFSEYRRNASIESCFGKMLRSLKDNYSANILKIDRPIIYTDYLDKEYEKLDALKASYENGFLTEDELKIRVEIQYERINAIREICFQQKIVQPFYYIVLFNIDKRQLSVDTANALSSLQQAELTVRRLSADKELAVFLKYTNYLDFDEEEADKLDPADYISWAMPERVHFTTRNASINNIISHQMRVVNYPSVVGDAWLAGVMSIPGTKVMVKITPMERSKAIRSIDRSLSELRGQYYSTGIDSKRLELEQHIETLSQLLVTLHSENEMLLTVNIYITMYDSVRTSEMGRVEAVKNTSLPPIADMKKNIRRSWQEAGMRLNQMDFSQIECFIGSQVSAYDPYLNDGRGMPANTVAGMFPWIYARVSDVGGIWLGNNDGVPVIIDFFRRDSERINSNMVIIGKTGAGKSYGTKSILTNLASEDAKIFILDPENEYSELAHNLHGKIIDVGNAKYGRLNPFNIITSLADDESGDEETGGFSAHLQFLEEFFKQILPDVDKDALEYLNTLVERLYMNFGITIETDLSKLTPLDYPIFDDLYDLVLEEFQRTSNQYLRPILQMLMNYVSKFASGGRNSNIWNGPSSITTDENFSVFNFQSLLANRNSTIANAQMLLVLKYIDNEIIKNRDYNKKYGLSRKIIVVIDEAHVFIDTKFPIALDFMFQLAKRIRKYNGMQIVITQNIKDFVGSEEISRKSTAIINACQYSLIFGLAPNDMEDLCKLYEKAGGINETEREEILTAPRGMAFTIMGPSSRSTFMVQVQQSMVDMFEQPDYQTLYFFDEKGEQNWENFVGPSRALHDKNIKSSRLTAAQGSTGRRVNSNVTFEELTPEEADLFYPDEQVAPQHGGVTFEELPPQPEYDDAPAQTLMTDQPAQQNAPMNMDQIMAAVREQVAKEFRDRLASELAANGKLSTAQPAPAQSSYPDGEEEELLDGLDENDTEYTDPDDEDGFFADEEDDDIEEEDGENGYSDDEIFSGDDEDEDEFDDDEDPNFDIMALLDEQLSSYDEMSIEERMDEIDVDTMEITLTDLSTYVRDMRKRRRA